MRNIFLLLTSLAAVGSVVAQDIQINVTHAVYCQRKTKNGDVISVNYNGTLLNGTLFDSSKLRYPAR